MYWFTWTLIGLILGLFLGFVLFFWWARSSIMTALYLYIKKQQQQLSVEKRLTHQLSDHLFDDLLNNAIRIQGFSIPLGELIKDRAPETYAWAKKTAARNPQAFWSAVGNTFGPFILGATGRIAATNEGAVMGEVKDKLSLFNANYLNQEVHRDSDNHGQEIAGTVPPSLQPPPTSEGEKVGTSQVQGTQIR